MTGSFRDRLLLAEITAIDFVRSGARTVRHRIIHACDDEKGQTPTEYLMIVGLMAAVIITVFVAFFWDTVKDSARKWVDKVKDAVTGSDIKPS